MTLTFKDTSIFYEVSGKGKPVVLLHGFLESSKIWKDLIPYFSEKHKVIIIDLLGHGKSGVMAEIHSMELMAEAVVSILVDLQIESAIFLGHSLGGYVTLALAEIFPEKVEKIILLNSSPAEDSKERKINRDRAIKIVNKVPEAFISMGINNLFAESTRELYIERIEELKNEALTFPILGITAAMKGMKQRKDRVEMLKNFNKPKIMICGIDDPVIPLNESKALSEETGCELICLDGGHMSWLENHNFLTTRTLIEKKCS